MKSQNIETTDIAAGRKALALRHRLIEARKSFIFETTLATLSLASTIKKLQSKGYKAVLNFLWIPQPKLCDFRVKERVSKGGHNIPLEVILRRHHLGLIYLNHYIELVDEANIYLAESTPLLIAKKDKKGLATVTDGHWEFLQNAIQDAKRTASCGIAPKNNLITPPFL